MTEQERNEVKEIVREVLAEELTDARRQMTGEGPKVVEGKAQLDGGGVM
jgi:hypothetical protein